MPGSDRSAFPLLFFSPLSSSPPPPHPPARSRAGGERARGQRQNHSTAMENESSTTTSSTGTTTIATTSSPSRTQPPQISVYSGSDRHAVQVIQQALHRPPSSAAQYLQQMYAAQQQHLMLQTAALQQQHLSSTPFQSLANVPQLISRSQTSNTSSSSLTQQTMLLGSTSPNLTASQAQMYLRAQMLIFTPATTVAAVQSDIPVVSSSSSFPCQSAATQVQNLTLRSQKLGVLSTSQNGTPKSSSQPQTLAVCPSKSVTGAKASQSDLESKRKGDSPNAEPRSPAVTRTSSIHQLMAPASYSPMQPHSLLKHQHPSLHSPPSKLSHHQLIFQQQQVQPITLQLPPSHEATPSQHCAPLQGHPLTPDPAITPSQHCTPVHVHPPPLSPTPSPSPQQSVVVSPPPPISPSQSPSIIIHPQTLIQSHPLTSSAHQSEHNSVQADESSTESTSQSAAHPPQLSPSPLVHGGPADRPSMLSPSQQMSSPSSHQPYPTLQPAPAPLATSPQLSSTPAHPQQMSLPPVPSLQVQPELLSQDQMLVQNTLVSEEELPAAEALVQLPLQTLPPPQTVAVNLQVQQAVPIETPVLYQEEDICEDEMPEDSDVARMARTPTPPTLSPPAITLRSREELSYEDTFPEQEGHSSMASSVSASVIKSPSDPSHASIPQPPLLLPAIATRTNSASVSNRNPSIENKLPQAIVKPQILTHVIEGFVIQEGLEPFPVSCSSLLIDEPAKKRLLLEEQVVNVLCVEPELQNNAKHADNSSDTEMEDIITEEGLDEMETDLLKCEFCGKMGYANKFLRSKRFCTMSCAKRYNVSCGKKFGLYSSDKSSRWSRSPDNPALGRRGRRPSGSDGAPREHFLRQLPITYPSAEEDLASQEDSVPVAMTTRLRRQSERERERELRELRIRKTVDNMDLSPAMPSVPSGWTVEDVWAFIRSLPGCQDIADEFRAQEIDGQALLLLKEDHLMSAMNIKLGPALKICARINSLKEL
ncbi:polyhomeotic-like protein 3 isoform X4 [Pantherophis guttatus]|uniref:Polyhomeotic-like protein 3 isoform X4 n=1 Tax=Pantherophis guttatus TaxID=94885 RepID=A0ABM3YSR6_PANGU|nr:polyhomeotic-like protein 3 isoform X4 [Pantherophis guttatus]